MGSDRELLELAARAAGIKGKYSEWTEMGEQHYKGFRQGAWGCWNPLDDDGDALRLAVRIHCIGIRNGSGAVEEMFKMFFSEELGRNAISEDECTRRAIVRAAAEIGKSL